MPAWVSETQIVFYSAVRNYGGFYAINSVDVVYLDLKKAFDTVPHQRLMCKRASYGIVRITTTGTVQLD